MGDLPGRTKDIHGWERAADWKAGHHVSPFAIAPAHNVIHRPVWLPFLDHIQTEDGITKLLQNGNYLHFDMHYIQQDLNLHEKHYLQTTNITSSNVHLMTQYNKSCGKPLTPKHIDYTVEISPYLHIKLNCLPHKLQFVFSLTS